MLSDFDFWSCYHNFRCVYCFVLFYICFDSTKCFAPPHLQSKGCYKLCCPTSLTTKQARALSCGRILICIQIINILRVFVWCEALPFGARLGRFGGSTGNICAELLLRHIPGCFILICFQNKKNGKQSNA